MAATIATPTAIPTTAAATPVVVALIRTAATAQAAVTIRSAGNRLPIQRTRVQMEATVMLASQCVWSIQRLHLALPLHLNLAAWNNLVLEQ